MRILLPILACGVLFISGCKKETKGCTDPHSFNYNAKATVSDNSCKEMYGCVGYSANMSNSGSIGNSFQNPYYDQKMSEEVYIQRNFFNGVPANVYVLYEPSATNRNAYATPDGNILFGYYMFYYTVQQYGELPVAGILAHEWGHRAQYTFGWNTNTSKVYQVELEADAFSGYYMALAKQWAWSQIQSYYANVYASGDYNYNHPSHHGTPNQRLTAAYLGVTTAVHALQTNTPYTYQQLHTIFINEIKSNIAPRINLSGSFPEVVYPKNLTPEKIKRLFPRL